MASALTKVADCLIFSYLVALAGFCVTYGIYVIGYGGAYAPAISINVILPLNTINNSYTLGNTTLLQTQMQQLHQASVKAVVVDVWWGLVELEPQVYTWNVYDDLFATLSESGLKVKVALSFHACLNDECNIPLPAWLNSASDNESIYYTDRHNNTYTEYLSSGVDFKPIFPPDSRRTAVGMYSDFIENFANHFSQYFDTLIYEVKVGLGPDGELRYPAFSNDAWTFPGLGEFQCYDSYLSNEYIDFATKAGHAEWAFLPNDTAGTYNSLPSNTTWFRNGGEYRSDYGQFFLNWYSNRLVRHGQAILGNAVAIIGTYSQNITVAAQLGCVYWQYKDASHAAELTAGYKNDNMTGYAPFFQMFDGLNVIINFGCFELSDKEMQANSSSGPEELVSQTLQNAQTYGTRYEGQNTNDVNTTSAYAQIEHAIRHDSIPIVGFDFRIDSTAFYSDATFNPFESFVADMTDPKKRK